MIKAIYSGGQTGVDIAALRAASSLGIPTGGTMPKGWLTLVGPRPEYAALYGMVEAKTADYPTRTRANVAAADLTIRVAVDFNSAGELCTYRAIRTAGKPWIDIQLHTDRTPFDADVRIAFLQIRNLSARLGRPLILNVAGNSERRAPGIERAAEVLLRALFARCQVLPAQVQGDP